MRKEFTLQRVSLIGMAAGLGMIVQPWSHALFAAGFPFTLAAIAGYNAAGWMSGARAEKALALARERARENPPAGGGP
jgi:hypothetical protein